MTRSETFDMPIDTVSLVALYKKSARRGHCGPRLQRVLRAVEFELARRATSALQACGEPRLSQR